MSHFRPSQFRASGVPRTKFIPQNRVLYISDAAVSYQDATSGWFLPETTAQWIELLAGTGLIGPCHLYLMQEAAGNVLDKIGTDNAGTQTMTYQQTETGWTRKFIKTGAQGGISNIGAINGTYPPLATTSNMAVSLFARTANFSATRDIMRIGYLTTSGLYATMTTTHRIQVYGPTGSVQGGTPVLATNTVVPLVLQHDRTNLRSRAIFLGESVFPVDFAHATGTDSGFSLGHVGAPPGGGNGPVEFTYYAHWTGSYAEMTDNNISVLLNRMENGPGPVGRDRLGGKLVPHNPTEWTTLLAGSGIGNPTTTWLLQEGAATTGPFADSVGTASLTNNGLTPRQASSNWTRVGIGTTVDGGGANAYNNTSFGRLLATSHLFLTYLDLPTVPGGDRTILGMGPSTSHRYLRHATDGKLIAANLGGGAVATGSYSYTGAGVFPVILQNDKTNSVWRIITHQEIIQPGAYTAPNADGFLINYGTATGLEGCFNALYGACFTGSNAEMSTAQVRTLLQSLGWSVSW